MSKIQPEMPQNLQAGQAPGNQRSPLALSQIAEGYYYSVQFAFSQFLNDPSPLGDLPTAPARKTSSFEVKQVQRRKRNGMLTDKDVGNGRICLVVGIENNHVLMLLASTQLRTTYAGTEHRWIPFEGSPNLPLQPGVVVKTAPNAAAFATPPPSAPKAYLCFTHALKVQPITAGMELPNMPTLGNGTFKHTKNFLNFGSMLYCPSINELKAVHEAYWQGVRYDYRGKRVAAPSGDPRGTGGSGSDPGGMGGSESDPRSGGKSSISRVIE